MDMMHILALMQAKGKNPIGVYKKTILGKVFVYIWDDIEKKPVEVILEGNPSNNDYGCYVFTWSDVEDSFFRIRNANHFKSGVIVEASINDLPKQEKSIVEATDEELQEILHYRPAELRKLLADVSSEAFLFRLLDAAEHADKTPGFLTVIKERINEVQSGGNLGKE